MRPKYTSVAAVAYSVAGAGAVYMRPKYTSVAAVAYSVAGAGAVYMRPKWHLYVIRQGELFFLRCVICWRMLTVFTTAIYVSSFVGGIYYCNICVLIRRSFWLRRQIHAYLLTYADGIYYCYICICVLIRRCESCSRMQPWRRTLRWSRYLLYWYKSTCFTGSKVLACWHKSTNTDARRCEQAFGPYVDAGAAICLRCSASALLYFTYSYVFASLMSTQVLLYVCVAAPQLYSTLHIAMCLRPLCRRRCCYMFALK